MTTARVCAGLSGAILMGATAASAGTILQDFDLTATASGQNSIFIDINDDGQDDFQIIVDDFQVVTVVDPSGVQPIIVGALFNVTEQAQINALEQSNFRSAIIADFNFEKEINSISEFGAVGNYARVSKKVKPSEACKCSTFSHRLALLRKSLQRFTV